MEYILYFLGFAVGLVGLIMALSSICETRKLASDEFLKRHKKILRRHNNYPGE